MSNKRGNKKHLTPLGQDFFALGSSSTASSNQVKLPAKRNEPFQSPISSMSPKRPKLNSPLSQATPASGQSSISMLTQSSSSNKLRSWEEKAIIVPAIELKDKILQFDSESDSEEMIERLLCGAVKQLREQKTKPDSCLVFTLLYLAKIRPLFFCSNIIVEAFSSLLKREHLIHFKSKNNTVPVLLINLFYYAFHDENSWPELFIKLYVEDSLGDRIWVDNEECKEFVEIIVASFRTKLPSKSLLQTSDVLNPTPKHVESSPSLTLSSSIGEDSVGEESCSSSTSLFYEQGRDSSNQTITSRYLDNENEIINYVFEIINENLNRRQTINDISRNMLKLLIATAGLRNVRLLVAQKLEHWFQNPKLSRPAQDLLLTIFLNCDEKDIETLNYLLKMRLKQKPFLNHFYLCFKESLNQKNGTFEIVLRILLTNELSGLRNLNNIQLLSIMFQQNATDATVILARFYFSMIYSKDDHLRILRNLLREIVRTMKSEPMDYLLFVTSLIYESRRFMLDSNATFEYSLKEKVVSEIVDIITMTIFLSVNQNVRESFARPERKEIMRNFQMKISSIQGETVAWIYEVTYHKYGFEDKESFIRLLRKILIFEPIDFYCKIDNWPSENERMIVYRLTSEGIPLREDTLKCILSMGFNREVPLSPQDACEVIWTLIHHATMNFDGDINYSVLLFSELNIINLLFRCCAYVCPENAKFPENYCPPNLARVDLYWKVWFMLVIIAAHIPSIFGDYAWKMFPTFQCMIEMAITNNFQFPPKSMDTDEMQTKILQFNQLEKLKILEFETYLARDREINETNSYLISTLITLDPTSIPRRPPNQILNDYKLLCTNSTNYRLCYLLCQSREPDFLLMIIDKQQNHPGSQIYLSSLNWLIDLVESYENNYGLLPVQCLCEFLLKQIAEETSSSFNMPEVSKLEKVKKKDKRRKLIRLIAHFQNDIQTTPSGQLSNAFQYLIRHLSHQRSTTRMYAYKALYVIVSINVEKSLSMLEENIIPSLFVDQTSEWFKTNLVKFLKSENQIQAMCQALNAALSEESNPLLICEYLEFIAQFVQQSNEILAFKCSSLLIQRKKIPTYIIMYSDESLKKKFLVSLYKIYWLYLESLLANPTQSSSDRIEGMKYVYVKFPTTTKTICINSYLIYGMILSLSYMDDDLDSAYFKNLSKLFFSEQYAQIFVDSELKQQEPLIPEWLVLRLLCSNLNQIISLVLANVRTENFVRFLNSYGLSMNATQRILQSLDKLNSAESRMIKNLNFDRQKLLNTIQICWSKGITNGYKFAKSHLNYKGDSEEKDDIEMVEVPSKKKEDKTMELRAETFKKDEIVKMFEDKDFKKLPLITRLIASELIDSNVKTKKMTKQFLGEFVDSLEDISEYIVKGTFNSIFNVIIISVLKDSKHFGLNQDLSAIKKALNSLKLENGFIKDTLLWKCFERFLYKESQKTKKSKAQKKKPQSKLSNSLEEFIQKNVFKNLNKKSESTDPWLDTYMDLAIEKYHKKDTDAENFNSHLQTVIFSRNRPYFLSLLLHKSNFSTLNDCICFILNENSRLNPTGVLDFLSICIDSPKLWIGREYDSQKVVKHEDVLNLSYEQIKKLIGYIIEENDIANRIDLILRTCCINTLKTEMVIYFLKDYKQESAEKISSELYTRLYLQIPNVGLDLKISDEHIALTQNLPSFMDKITHNLITSFMFVETNSGPVHPQLFIYWEYAMLHVASKHPLLFIRQIPMIPAMLRGKVNVVHYDIFKNLNLLRIFSKLLNILNLLRPYLWNRNVRGLEQILNLYMDMFISYYQLPRLKEPNHELLPLIVQFLRLIDDWVKHDSEQSNKWIKQHKNDFTELSSAYHNEQNLFKSIISGLPSQDEAQIIMASQHYQTLQINLKVSKLPNEVVISTLSDINKLIDKYPLLGENFLNLIQPYYSNPFFSELSFTITLKTLQTNPNLARTVVSSYVKSLQNESATVIKNALNILPEFVLLAQDYRYLLLRKVFELAIAGNTNATPALIEAFRALNSQIGC